MPYVTGFERLAIARAIKRVLHAKFGDDSNELAAAISKLHDASKYDILITKIATATTLAEARRAYVKVAAPPRKKGGSGKRSSPETTDE